MEHYCSKCLVNRVEHEGDICAACGGTRTTERSAGRNNFRPSAPDDTETVWSDGTWSNDNWSGSNEPVHEYSAPTPPAKRGGLDFRSGIIQNFTTGAR